MARFNPNSISLRMARRRINAGLPVYAEISDNGQTVGRLRVAGITWHTRGDASYTLRLPDGSRTHIDAHMHIEFFSL